MIEGFYGRPWPHEARLANIRFLAARGMNAYVYAPKDDPRHRSAWRERYGPDEEREFAELAEASRDQGVRFGFALSPGLDIAYDRPDDRTALWEKLERLAGLGVDWFVIAFDDIPPAEGAGGRQADLAAWVLDRLTAAVPDARLSFVPTDYVGTKPTPYLDELARRLPTEIDVMWTGPTVVSPTITAADARARAEACGGRPPLVWDNYPVNDGVMEPTLHLGPLRGREPDVAATTAGLLANPMSLPWASLLPLATVADFLRDPDGYDPDESWARAIDDLAGEEPAALRALGEACAASPLGPPEHLLLHRLIDAYERGGAALDELEATLEAPRDLAARLPDEVRPWAEQVEREAAAGRTATRLLRHLDAGAGGSDLDLVLRTFMLQGAWIEARRHSSCCVYGPRFACYPAVVQARDGGITVDPAEAVLEDRSAIDRLCRLALARLAERGG